MSKILCTICVRGGSKGVKNKNIRPLNGLPLIAHTIKQAQESKLFEHIVISTDSDDIANVATKFGAEVFFKRSKELSSDSAAKIPVIKDAFIRSEIYYNTKFDYLIDLDATAPLRSSSDIIKAFEQFKKDDNDILITGVKSRRSPYFNLVEIVDNKVVLSKALKIPIVRRQDAPKCYDMNASIYIWKRESILNENSLFADKTGLYEMSEESMFDIDSELDFEFVEFLLKRKNA